MGILDFLKPGNNKKADPFELLKKDHRTVEELFKRLEEDKGQREALFEQLKSELELHTRIEETIFYPPLKKEEETRAIVLEAFEEHKGVKTLLEEMDQMPKSDERWDAKLTVLKENVEHHVGEEEGEMFQKARDVLSDEEQARLGERMEQEKNKSLMGEQTEVERKNADGRSREPESAERKGESRQATRSRSSQSGRKGASNANGRSKTRSSAARSTAGRKQKGAQVSQPARKRKKDQRSSKRVVTKKTTSRKKR